MANDIKQHIDEFLKIHKAQIANSQKKKVFTSKEDFNHHQEEFFDDQAHWYESEKACPPAVRSILTTLLTIVSNYITKTSDIKILDVGSGAGVLIAILQEIFNSAIIQAIDISAKQLANLQKKYPDITVFQSDITRFSAAQKYDLIICNACFGNFYSQTEALAAMWRLLTADGLVVISHPLGARFVAHLHHQDVSTVPHTLPTSEAEIYSLTKDCPFIIEKLIANDSFYLLILRKK